MARSSRISCLVPVYNGERYIAEALDSLLAQTLLPREIIVVDDGSTDGTAEIVRGYGPPVFCLHQENAAAARNRGLQEVQGDLVAYLDADDIAVPERIERQMARFEIRPELDASLAYVENFWDDDLRHEMEGLDSDNPWRKPLPGTVTQAGLARRGVLTSIPFDPEIPICHDQDWYVRATECGTVIEVLPEILVKRRMHRNSLSHSGRDAVEQDMLLWVKKALDRRRSVEP
ncbi:MAG TPA: glycosyltransferase family A protein [Gemmatimonadota bacterium]|nr:glycosyltransferase family A protein [Gemmatimonadota bacterium]